MASAHKRKFLVLVTRGRAGKLSRRRITKAEAERLRAAGERVEEREGERWYVRYRDAGGAWRDERSTARTKAEAPRLAGDLERKAERQRYGLELLPGDPGIHSRSSGPGSSPRRGRRAGPILVAREGRTREVALRPPLRRR